MRWPWVSRLAYELVLDERDRLRGEVDQFRNALVAIERKHAGMPELPRQPSRSPQQAITIPPEMEERIQAVQSGAHRASLRTQAENLARAGAPWSDIIRQYDLETGGIEEALSASVVEE